jgi:DNA-binding HxlR family transcriptional regulator
MSKRAHPTGSYGQYCPLALAAELLCRRWTILVVSRLLDGCRTFSEIHQGIPRISPSLLSTRLTELEDAGLLKRMNSEIPNRYRYEPTEATLALNDIIDNLAAWGQRWARDMENDDLDPGFLAWSMHTRLNSAVMPEGRTVIEFEFTGAPADCRRFWLVHNDGSVDMCLKNPGYESDLLVQADLRRFVETWRGFRDLREEIRTRHIRLHGPRVLQKQFPDWLLLSAFASQPRMCAGREQRLNAKG